MGLGSRFEVLRTTRIPAIYFLLVCCFALLVLSFCFKPISLPIPLTLYQSCATTIPDLPPVPDDPCELTSDDRNVVPNVFLCPNAREQRSRIDQFAYVTFEKSGSSSMHFLLERKTKSTWRLGLPKRIMYHNMSVSERLQYQTVSANSFGVHKAPRMENYVIGYSMLMREPIPRALSEYFYRRVYEPYAPNKVEEGETLLYHSQVHGNYVLKRLTLMEDCMHISDVWDHFTCVTHRTDAELAWGLEVMKRNLKRWFAVVGVLERFDEWLVLNHFAFREPWEPCSFEANVHSDLYANISLGDWHYGLLKEYNKYDMSFYQAMSELFEEQVQAAMQDPEIRPYLQRARAGKLPLCPRKGNN